MQRIRIFITLLIWVTSFLRVYGDDIVDLYPKISKSVYPLYVKEEKRKLASCVIIHSYTPLAELVFLTARHCIERKPDSIRDGICIALRVDAKDTSYSNVMCFDIIKNRNYFRFDDFSIDIAALVISSACSLYAPSWASGKPLLMPDAKLIGVLGASRFSYEYPIGSKVVALGFPKGFGAFTDKVSRPVLVSGRIAYDLAKVYPQGRKLLGDYYSLPGMSGGAVFLIEGKITKFIGINVGHFADTYELDSLSFDYLELDSYRTIKLNSRLSVIYSTEIIRQLLYKTGVWLPGNPR